MRLPTTSMSGELGVLGGGAKVQRTIRGHPHPASFGIRLRYVDALKVIQRLNSVWIKPGPAPLGVRCVWQCCAMRRLGCICAVVCMALVLVACGEETANAPAPRLDSPPLPMPVQPRGSASCDWTWDAPVESWAEESIVFGGTRRVAPEGLGLGAEFAVAVAECSSGVTDVSLADTLADWRNREARSFLMDRCYSSALGRLHSVETLSDEHDSEGAILRVFAGAPNLRGHVAPCHGVMTVRRRGNRLYRVRAYAWCTEHDDEGLLGDLDVLLTTYTPEYIEEVLASASVKERCPVPAPCSPTGQRREHPRHDGAIPSWAMLTSKQLEEARRFDVPAAFENDLGMRFVLIPGGTFTLGLQGTEAQPRDPWQSLEVSISKPYYMQIREVTNRQFCIYRPSHESGEFRGLSLDEDDQPVVWVSHEDAMKFAAWASRRDRVRSYLLPTEAQWEYACRAGTTTRYSWGDSEARAHKHANVWDAATHAHFAEAGDCPLIDDGYRVTAPVGSYLPNRWGLYDMHGNVWEWCRDWVGMYPSGPVHDYTGPLVGDYRVLRGGAWDSWLSYFESATRHTGRRTDVSGSSERWRIGFRLISPLPGLADGTLSHNEGVLAVSRALKRERGVRATLGRARRDGRPGEVGWSVLKEAIDGWQSAIEKETLQERDVEASSWLDENVTRHTTTTRVTPLEPYTEARIADLLRNFLCRFGGSAAARQLRVRTGTEPWSTFRRILEEHALHEADITTLLDAAMATRVEALAKEQRFAEEERFAEVIEVYERLKVQGDLLVVPEARDAMLLAADARISDLKWTAEGRLRFLTGSVDPLVRFKGHVTRARELLRDLYFRIGVPSVERKIELELAGLD